MNRTTHGIDRIDRIAAALREWAWGGCSAAAPDGLDVFGTIRLSKAVTAKFVGKVTLPRNALTDAIDAWTAASAATAAK